MTVFSGGEERPRPATAHAQSGLAGRAGRWWWQTASIASGLVFAVIVLAGTRYLARPLALFALGLVVAESLSPIVDIVDRWLPRTPAVIVVYLMLAMVAVILGALIVPAFFEQAQEMLGAAPALLEDVQSWLERIPGVRIEDLQGMLADELGRIGGLLLELPLLVVESLIDLFFVLFLSIYWLVQGPARHRFVLSLVPPAQREELSRLLRAVGQAMGGFIRGTAIDGSILAALTYLGLQIIGLPFTVALALFAGLMEFFPVIGPIIAAVPILAVALLESVGTALVTLAFILVLQQFESNVLLPNVMRGQTHVSPVLSLIAVYVGGALGGLVGALVAIPLMAAARVLVIEVVAPAIRRTTGAEQAEPTDRARVRGG